jgi:CSLREA domain-containing protein
MAALWWILIFALVLVPTHSFATKFQVTKTDDTSDGACDTDRSLREAIEAANAIPGVDDVPVPAGDYLLALGSLVISDVVRIAGAGLERTSIDGDDSTPPRADTPPSRDLTESRVTGPRAESGPWISYPHLEDEVRAGALGIGDVNHRCGILDIRLLDACFNCVTFLSVRVHGTSSHFDVSRCCQDEARTDR